MVPTITATLIATSPATWCFKSCRSVDAAHNPTLSEPVPLSTASAQLRETLNIVPRRQAVFDLHVDLLDAVEQRDPERAAFPQAINEPNWREFHVQPTRPIPAIPFSNARQSSKNC